MQSKHLLYFICCFGLGCLVREVVGVARDQVAKLDGLRASEALCESVGGLVRSRYVLELHDAALHSLLGEVALDAHVLGAASRWVGCHVHC